MKLGKKILVMLPLFTFAVVEELLCEDGYVKHSSVLSLCVFLLLTKQKKED